MAAQTTQSAFKSVHDTVGQYCATRPFSLQELLDFAHQLLHEKYLHEHTITNPHDFRDLLRVQLGAREHEIFWIAFLDNRHRILAMEEMFRGTLDGASVYPREVVKSALSYNAAAVIFAHNHPSGVAEPSQADRSITKRLTDALNLVDIRVLDHFVVAGADIISFAEAGLL